MQIKDTRSIHITEYLEKIGAKFARSQMGTNGLEYVYHCPNRKDLKPSLCVNIKENIWSDVPQNVGGRIIELVCHIHGLDYGDVSGALGILDNTFSGYYQKPVSVTTVPVFADKIGKNAKNSLQLLSIQDLYQYPLKNYLVKERKIPLSIANKYLKEIFFSKGNTKFYALGFPSGKTYVLRNKFFKGVLSSGLDISIFDKGTSEIYLFEGFIDFLSYLAFQGKSELSQTVIVLNSVAFLSRFQVFLEDNAYISRVLCFLDNDNGGDQFFLRLEEKNKHIEISDRRQNYKNFKDFNDWWISR